MRTSLQDGLVRYRLETGSGDLLLNDWIGRVVRLRHTGLISCLGCSKTIQRTYNDGYCFQCLQSLAECDECMMKPELCHYERGTCRDPAWGRANCLVPHRVYLARSSAVKVGITREDPVEVRWMDQGAVEGMVIALVPDRKTSGLMETAIARRIEDRTDFRKMLRGEVAGEPLEDVFRTVEPYVPAALRKHLLPERRLVAIRYPLEKPPGKIKVATLDRQPDLRGVLEGIKGQYLVFDGFVMNVRAHGGHEVELSAEDAVPAAGKDGPAPSLFDMLN